MKFLLFFLCLFLFASCNMNNSVDNANTNNTYKEYSTFNLDNKSLADVWIVEEGRWKDTKYAFNFDGHVDLFIKDNYLHSSFDTDGTYEYNPSTKTLFLRTKHRDLKTEVNRVHQNDEDNIFIKTSFWTPSNQNEIVSATFKKQNKNFLIGHWEAYSFPYKGIKFTFHINGKFEMVPYFGLVSGTYELDDNKKLFIKEKSGGGNHEYDAALTIRSDDFIRMGFFLHGGFNITFFEKVLY